MTISTRMDYLTEPEEADDVIERVLRHWYLGGPFPEPLFKVKCPDCDSGEPFFSMQSGRPIYRQARFFKKGNGDATISYRCDANFKCGNCSRVWTYGIAIPKELWDLHGSRTITYTRAQIRRYLEEMG